MSEWYNSLMPAPATTSPSGFEGDKIPYTALANYANDAMTERPQYKKTLEWLKSAYTEGRMLWWELRDEAIAEVPEYTGVKDEQSDDGTYRADWMEERMWDKLYEYSARVIPYGDYDRWAIFTDMIGWEIEEEVWEYALIDATTTEKDDRGIIAYRVLTHMTEQVMLAGYNDKFKGGFFEGI